MAQLRHTEKMSSNHNNPLKVLVAIASYGTSNDQYLNRIIQEYRSMRYDVHIVVLSNIHKPVPEGVELRVGLPAKDPWSLPFAHKAIFADRIDSYDVFIYSEDDVLITERNVQAFLEAYEVLPAQEIAGFLRFETGPKGEISYPEVHHRYHWEPRSVCTRGDNLFAYFTNEHAACYVLTREQLRRAIASGGFLLEPHSGRYDMLCAAATDPYTRCGLKKMIGISRLSDFLVHHLPNKYVGKLGLLHHDFQLQIDALKRAADTPLAESGLLEDTPECTNWLFSKNYYEPVREDLLSSLPSSAHNILSVGCGWGAAEEELKRRGKRVVAVPLDPIVSACVKARGVETIECDGVRIPQALRGEKFDCVFISNVLHLTRDPVQTLNSLMNTLSNEGVLVAVVPNLSSAQVLWKRAARKAGYQKLRRFESAGVHLTSTRRVKKWLRNSGLAVDNIVKIVPARALDLRKWTFGVFDSILASELVFVAKRNPAATVPVLAKNVVRACNG
jgi:trans-aconitate methyltransferase